MHFDRKKLLIISINFAPELTGIGKYTGDMAEWLSRRGTEVKVVTAPPYYPDWVVKQGYSAFAYKIESMAGATVYRCPVWVPKNPHGLTRVLHLLSFGLTSMPVALWLGLRWRPDIVFVVEPPLSSAPGAWLAAKLGGAKAWLHVQDFEVDAAFDLGLLRSPFAKIIVLSCEKWLMRRFARISSISGQMLAKLRHKGVESERVLLFPNWVDTEQIYPLEGASAYREELGIPAGVRVLLYSGNMGEKQGLEILLDAARALADDTSVLFLLCGTGATRRRIENAAQGLANVRFIELQPLEKLNELLNLADIHLLPQRADAEDLVMPSKLTAMMASGHPVVATAREGSELARVVAEGGLLAPPGQPAALVAVIRTLLDDAGLRAALGRSARAYAITNWDKNVILRRVFAELAFRVAAP